MAKKKKVPPLSTGGSRVNMTGNPAGFTLHHAATMPTPTDEFLRWMEEEKRSLLIRQRQVEAQMRSTVRPLLWELSGQGTPVSPAPSTIMPNATSDGLRKWGTTLPLPWEQVRPAAAAAPQPLPRRSPKSGVHLAQWAAATRKNANPSPPTSTDSPEGSS